MAILTKKQIREAKKLKQEQVSVPEWGGEVFVRELTGKERDALETASVIVIQGKPGEKPKYEPNAVNMRARLAAFAICDAQGNRLFTEDEITELGEHSGAALERIHEVAAKLSGLRKSDIEGSEKNSGDAPSGVSGSSSVTVTASPSTSSNGS